jgi:hypothetical protein
LIAISLVALAVACLVAGAVLLRSLGASFRVGRLLAATPTVDIDDAIEIAATDKRNYVRVVGRISSEEEFPDENDRPLVFRRKRLEIADVDRAWRSVADEREAVPFGVETRSAFIAVDEAAIDIGLVAIPRESQGQLRDLPPGLLAGIADLPPPEARARLVIEQLSAVEHATVCGMAVVRDGRPTLTSGTGRPLIITTLEAPAAMRLIAAGHRGRAVGGGVLLLVGLGLATAGVVAGVAGL